MNRIAAVAVSLGAMLATSCASVSRDAGLAKVQKTIADRAQQTVVPWTDGPSPADEERVRAMLEDELTGDEAVAIAVANNPRLQVTLAGLGFARADLIEASTISNPLLEFEIRVPAEPRYPYEIRLAQSLLDLIHLPLRKAAGRAEFDAATLRVASEVLRFAESVRAAYYDLIAAAQHASMSRTIAESARAGAELALKQHAAENITDLDLENEQATYEQAKLDLASTEQRLLLAREALIRSMALREVPLEWRVPETFPDPPASELALERLEQLAATQRFDIAIAKHRLEVAERQVPISRLAVLRGSELDVHYEKEPDGADTVGPGLELPIPIFDTGRAARTRAEAEYLRARHTLSALMAESASQLRAVAATVAAARVRTDYYRDVLLPRRMRIVALTQLEHNAMLVGVFQLLQAKQSEVEARRDFIDAQRDYWGARMELDRVTNGVDADGIGELSVSRGAERRSTITRGGHE